MPQCGIKNRLFYGTMPQSMPHSVDRAQKRGTGKFRFPLEIADIFLLEVTVQQAFLVLTSFISLASAQKHESSLIPLLVLSESNPLALGFDSVVAYLKYLLSRPSRPLL
jgi:hypothetical protein